MMQIERDMFEDMLNSLSVLALFALGRGKPDFENRLDRYLAQFQYEPR